MTADEYVNKLFLHDRVVVSVEKDGTNYHVSIDPKLSTYRDLDRLYAKSDQAAYNYHVGIVFSYKNDDNTFGPIGRFGAGCPKFI